MLSDRLRNSLSGYGSRVAVEEAGGFWRLDGDQLLAAAAELREVLRPHEDGTLIAYLRKGPLYYGFLACAFVYRLDFCPLDIENPVQRVLDIAQQLVQPLIVCDDADVLKRLQEEGASCMQLELSFAGHAPQEPRRGAGHYLIATSGSTGMPKLVQVPHERTMAFLDWAIPFYGVNAASRWGQFSSAGFDLSLADFLCTLCGGGTLISLAEPMDRIRPAQATARAGLTHWHSVPSMIPYFLRELEIEARAEVQVFSFCGEPFLREDAEGLARRYPGARIVNTYGPTEATLFCSCFEYGVDADPGSGKPSLPIGHPIPGWNFVLRTDREGDRLVIVSDHLSDGYLGQDAAQFTSVRLFDSETKAFDTGDYVRVVGTQLYFSHRKDLMVKVNGNRIDMGEVEAAGKRAGLVNPVASVVDSRIVLAAEGSGEARDARAALGRFLPRASVPSEIRFVASHPRTVSGKLDRKAIVDGFVATRR